MAPKKRTTKATPKVEKIVTEEDLLKQKAQAEAKSLELDNQLREKRLERNTNLIKNIVCGECGATLPIDLEIHVRRGNTAKDYPCAKCDNTNRVKISFVQSPADSDPEITVKVIGLSYMLTPVGDLTKEQVTKRVIYEASLVEAGSAQLDPRTQLLLMFAKFASEIEE